MDRTLRAGGGITRTRSVLSRTERIATLMEEGKFDPTKDSPMGLPKVKVRHSKAGHKAKKAAEETPAAEGAAPGAAAAAPAAAAADAKAAKPAAKPAAKEDKKKK
ncbi:MAG TPA: small basic protein [Phycisphaerae bacterium]|nr:small basic protein [Phycisphaerae bacterium]